MLTSIRRSVDKERYGVSIFQAFLVQLELDGFVTVGTGSLENAAVILLNHKLRDVPENRDRTVSLRPPN